MLVVGRTARAGLAILWAAAAMTAATGTAAEPPPESDAQARQYAVCMALAETDAQGAFDMALGWRDIGGGDAATHCLAKSLFYLKQYAEAARRFEALAQSVKSGPEMKAELLKHAAQAWMQDNDPERAADVLTAAIGLDAADVELWIDRGLARADFRAYRLAIEDFSHALALDPDQPDVYAFRAAAHRYLKDPGAAAADLDQALTLDSENIEALLERGILRRLGGDDAGARADWLLVLELAPDTPAAAAAQDNLQKMELKPDG